LSECIEADKEATEKKYFMDGHIHLLFFAMAVPGNKCSNFFEGS